MDSKPGRLNIGVIGAGRVGAVVAAALGNAGHRVVAASGASEDSVSRIETLLPAAAHVAPNDVPALADLVLVTVPDDSLGPLVDGLGQLGAWRPGQLLVHCAGRYGVKVLDAAGRAGAIPLAIHPAMTFSGTSIDLGRLRDAAFAVTAPAAFLPIAQALVVEMGGEPVVIAEEHRPAYHAALVHGANHAVTLMAQASAQLAKIGVEEPGRLLTPLVRASIDKALSDAPGAVTTLTGPVVRGDSATVAAHVAALASDPTALAAYRAMCVATADLALAGRRISPGDYAEVIAALGELP